MLYVCVFFKVSFEALSPLMNFAWKFESFAEYGKEYSAKRCEVLLNGSQECWMFQIVIATNRSMV